MRDPADAPTGDHSSAQQSSVPDPAPAAKRPEPLFAEGDPVPHGILWVLERRLGKGGFGEVWLARHKHDMYPPVAVKFCTHRRLTAHELYMIVRVMKHIGNHPNVIPILNCDPDGDLPWLMYEYVEGGTLAQAVKEEWRALPPGGRRARAIRTLHAIAAPLAALHALDDPIVHRDLKPSNVLMSRGVPRITDFGIGALARPLGLVGTHSVPTEATVAASLLYCSPERLRGIADGRPTDPHPLDDVYALGVIAYQLLRADLQARPGSDAARHLRALDTPPALIDLITDSVAEDPAFRPKNAGEWERVLAAWLPAKAAPAGSGAPGARRVAVGVPGKWSAREAGTGAAWNPVAETPGDLQVVPNTEYLFHPLRTITDDELAGLRALSGAPWFRALDLSWCEQVTDAGLSHLTALTQLRDLDLSGCARLTDDGLSFLTVLKELTHLDLSCCPQITDGGLGHLAHLPRLLYVTLLICAQLTDAGVEAFRAAVPGREVRD